MAVNLISDLHQVETLAEIGVVLLLFTIGLKTSLTQMRASSRNASQGIPTKMKEHVTIVGYGLNGRNLARVLGDLEIPYVVPDVNPDPAKLLKKTGAICSMGTRQIPEY